MKLDETVMRAGGPLVKDYGTHFLRDDTEIRKLAGCFGVKLEAYSLFCVDPYGRVEVFCGPRDWVIKESDAKIAARGCPE